MDETVYIKVRNSFLKELKDSSSGKKTSFDFIINPLPKKPLVAQGETFQTIVVGGSMGKIAKVKKTQNGIEVLYQEEIPQPKFDTKEIFLNYLDTKLHIDTKVLALDFAFPLEPVLNDGVLDGILLNGSKEHEFSGLVGQDLGKDISLYFSNKRHQNITVSCANDTICLLLSGLTKYKKENLACGILGTGMNGAFFLNQNEMVNLESAGFDKFERSSEGKIIDKQSLSPGRALFEKEVAGVYLYKHFNLIIKKKRIDFAPINSTVELKNLSHQKIPQISQIANDLMDRSAGYICAQIAAITQFKKKDMVFVMDGSFFWEASYKRRVDKILPKLSDFNIKLVEIQNNTVLGPAHLVI